MKSKGITSKCRLTIRVTQNQSQLIKELSEKMNTSQSVLLRAIIGSWLTTNEPILDDILSGKKIINLKEDE